MAETAGRGADAALLNAADWGAMPEDVCKIVLRHLDLGALVRFGGACRAFRLVSGLSPAHTRGPPVLQPRPP